MIKASVWGRLKWWKATCYSSCSTVTLRQKWDHLSCRWHKDWVTLLHVVTRPSHQSVCRASELCERHHNEWSRSALSVISSQRGSSIHSDKVFIDVQGDWCLMCFCKGHSLFLGDCSAEQRTETTANHCRCRMRQQSKMDSTLTLFA